MKRMTHTQSDNLNDLLIIIANLGLSGATYWPPRVLEELVIEELGPALSKEFASLLILDRNTVWLDYWITEESHRDVW